MSKTVTGEVRLSYAHVWEAKASAENAEPKYSVSLIIPKKDKKTIEKIEAAIKEALEEGKSKKFGGSIPKKRKIPLRDGDEEREDDAYAGSMFINCNSKERPLIIDSDKEEILDKNEVYSGCYAKVSLSFYPYDFNGTKGIGCGLRAIMKTRDGEPLGGSRASADEFDDEDEL